MYSFRFVDGRLAHTSVQGLQPTMSLDLQENGAISRVMIQQSPCRCFDAAA